MATWKIALIVFLSLLALVVGFLVWFLVIYPKAPSQQGYQPPSEIVDPDVGPGNPDDPNNPSSGDPLDPDTGDVNKPKVYKDGYYNILIAGTDHDGLRTDTLMVARIDTVNHTVALVSIPRDTYIETASGHAKINSVYAAYGCGSKGMGSLMYEVEDLLGFMPNGYVLINLDAFMELVNVVGGVDFNIPVDMYHVDPTQDLYIDLKAGYQHLDGNKAMQLVRYRGYGTADIERTRVQQRFITALAKKCVSISNVTKIDDFVDIFARNVMTTYDTSNLVFLAQELLKCDFSSMATYTLAGEGGHYIDGIDYYVLNEESVKNVIMKDFYPYVD